MSTRDAIRRIRAVAEDTPDAVVLARLASLAIRIEPNLLRRLRTTLMPEADVSAEADLWFSPLIDSAGADSIVLDPDVAEVLRTDLARDGELLDRTARITREAHAHLPPALRIEEEVTALALSGADDASDRIDRALARALRTLTQDPARAKETARWFMRAWPRLPERVRRTRSAATLALASSVLTRRRSRARPIDSNASLDDVRWVFADQSFTAFDRIGAELADGRLRFVESAEPAGMRVPRTDPPVIELTWNTDAGGTPADPVLVDATPGMTVSLPAGTRSVTLTTLAGDIYEVTQARADDDTPAASTPSDTPWIDIEPFARFAAGCVRVTADAGPERIVRTGYRLTRGHIATERSSFPPTSDIRVEPGQHVIRRAAATEAAEGPVFILPVRGGEAPGFASPPFAASRTDPASDLLRAEPKDAVALGFVGDTLRAIPGTAVIDSLMAARFTVYVESAIALPDDLLGGPVIMDDDVRGIVTGITPREGSNEEWALTVAGGTVLKEALDRAVAVGPGPAQRTAGPAGAAAPAVDAEAEAGQPEQAATRVTGNRVAKVALIGPDQRATAAVLRHVADEVLDSRGMPRTGLWWDDGRRDPDGLRAAVVVRVVRIDDDWPLALDLQDAALAVLVAATPRAGKTMRSDPVARLSELKAMLRQVAPSLPVLSTGDLPETRRPAGKVMEPATPDRDTLRQAIVDGIDWTAQPELDDEARAMARKLATESIEQGPPVMHLEQYLEETGSRYGTDWPPVLHPMLGLRTVDSASLVFRDPGYFETLVIAIARAVAKEQPQPALPAAGLESVQRFAVDEPGVRVEGTRASPEDIVRAAMDALRQAGLAAIVSTDYGPVVVLPWKVQPQPSPYGQAQPQPLLRAEWTGDARLGFLALVAALTWQDGDLEEIGWDPAGTGAAVVRRNGGRFRVEAAQTGPLADLTAYAATADVRRVESGEPVRRMRAALEEALEGNRSLTIIDEPPPAA